MGQRVPMVRGKSQGKLVFFSELISFLVRKIEEFYKKKSQKIRDYVLGQNFVW